MELFTFDGNLRKILAGYQEEAGALSGGHSLPDQLRWFYYLLVLKTVVTVEQFLRRNNLLRHHDSRKIKWRFIIQTTKFSYKTELLMNKNK